MKKLKNEQGYALLVVVLLVVLIMGFFTVFMTASLSNAKQEEIVDKNNLSIVAAEMGVDYYVNNFKNAYYSHTVNIEQFVQREIENSFSKNQEEDFTRIQLAVEKELKSMIKNKLTNDPKNESNTIIGDYTFGLSEPKEIEIQENKLIVKGIVLGKIANSEFQEELEFEQTFHVPVFSSFLSTNNSEINLPEIEEKFFQGYKPSPKCEKEAITEEFNNKECSYLKGKLDLEKLKMNKSSLYVEDDLYVKNEYFEIENSSQVSVDGNVNIQKLRADYSELSVKGNLSIQNETEIRNNSEVYVRINFSSDKLNINDSKLYVGGVATLKNNVNLTNSEVYIKTNLESDQKDGINNIHLINSKLYVGGNLESKNNTDIHSNSILFINGNLDLKNNTVINENSNICVAGKLTHKNGFTVEEGSAVYVLGTSTAKEVTIVHSLEELKQYCSVSNEVGLTDVKWLEPEVEVTY